MAKYFLILSLVTLATNLAHAQKSVLPEPRQVNNDNELKPHVGLRLGLADPNDNHDDALEYGLEVGFQPYVPFGLGIELAHFHSDSGETVQLERTKLLSRLTYNFGGDIPVIKQSYAGVGLGPVLDRLSSTDYLRFGTDATVGFDIPLAKEGTVRDSWTVGANANYLWVTDTDADTFSLNGLVKYWF